jgi:hypothetical protein
MIEIYGRFRKTGSFQLSNIRNRVKNISSIYKFFFIFNLEGSFQNFGEVSPDFLLRSQQQSPLDLSAH